MRQGISERCATIIRLSPGFSNLSSCSTTVCHQNVLDITHDLDVALFFAQNQVTPDSRMVPVDYGTEQPVLYLFLLMPQLDRFINSRQLSESYQLERPLRQKCGLLCGASFITRNFYARFIALKIHLRAPIQYDDKLTPDFVFPGRDEDPFLDDLLQFQEKERLTMVRPFVLPGRRTPRGARYKGA